MIGHAKMQDKVIMSFTPHYRLGPSFTPRPLKILILATLTISLFCGVTDHLFPHYFNIVSPQQLLSLSSWGMHLFYFWQWISYLFVHPLTVGISFSFLLSVAFNTYLLWVIGTSLIERKGSMHFFALYFLSGLITGLVVSGLQVASSSSLSFAGNGATLYALLIGWLMIFPKAELLLFLAIPIRASWLILGILGINLLIDLSTGDWIRVLGYTSASLSGYLYAFFFWKQREAQTTYTQAKRFDFKTGKAILSDEEFLDAMLTKIALNGKSSLSWKERWRLRRISKRKKH